MRAGRTVGGVAKATLTTTPKLTYGRASIRCGTSSASFWVPAGPQLQVLVHLHARPDHRVVWTRESTSETSLLPRCLPGDAAVPTFSLKRQAHFLPQPPASSGRPATRLPWLWFSRSIPIRTLCPDSRPNFMSPEGDVHIPVRKKPDIASQEHTSSLANTFAQRSGPRHG